MSNLGIINNELGAYDIVGTLAWLNFLYRWTVLEVILGDYIGVPPLDVANDIGLLIIEVRGDCFISHLFFFLEDCLLAKNNLSNF